jgi:hypothetical protein
MLSNSTNSNIINNSYSSSITIFDAFEFALNITAAIPCLAIIIIYLILKKELKYPHYFKLELMFILLIIILLDFFLVKLNNEEIEKIINLIQSYLEIVLVFLLLSFSCLCYSLSKTKNNDSSKALIIALTLGSWILAIYRIKFNIDLENNYNFIAFIVNVCVISCIFLLDLIFYILIIVNMCSIKKKDEDNKKYYNKNIKRMTINFMCHISFFSVSLYNIIKTYKLKKKLNEKQKDYLDLLISLSYNFISYVCFLEGKTTEYLKNKFSSCFSIEKLNTKDDDEEESESDDDDDDDDDEDIQLYNENDESISSN